MGNSSSGRVQEGGECAEVIRLELDHCTTRPDDDSDSMGNTPPGSPSSSAREPLMFSPQVPMVPILKNNDGHIGFYLTSKYDWRMQSENHQEQGIPAIIQWMCGGQEVYIEGSWDNWQKRTRLQKAGNDFTIVKLLLPGVYQFRFVVDGEFRYSPDLPFTHDERGQIKNILDLQVSVPENVESISGFEPPQSPNSTYNSLFPSGEDFSKEPPSLPPQLHLTLLDMHDHVDPSTSSFVRPKHVILNHLYVEKGRTAQSVLALGFTHRFHSKYVTVVLYKPLPTRTALDHSKAKTVY